jgi:transcriptional regulator with GAF, ATPase, and Fis domain
MSTETGVARAELHVIDGPDAGTRAVLAGAALRVGTSASCDLRLTDDTVSRFHFEIRPKAGACILTDLGSTNGTFVDGVPILVCEALSGASIRCGRSVIRVHMGEKELKIPTSMRIAFGGLIGASIEMRQLYAILERVAPTDATVLVGGETGTGKEVVARAVHQASLRAANPFVAVDCGAFADHLIESELFGHLRGAFTGAVANRRGLFDEADGGTIFLDEIGELPLALQPKLLRLLETREVRPVGANVSHKVDVRIVAATNRPLAQSVNDGTFREDLYYRLAVVEVLIPPLRARRDDLLLLARHFHKAFAGPDAPFPMGLVPTLMARGWPGNVRELRNFIERSVATKWASDNDDDTASPEAEVPPGMAALIPVHLPLSEAREEWIKRFESLYIRALLKRTGGNITQAALAAGVNRRWMQRLMTQQRLRQTTEAAGDDDDDGDDGDDDDENA